jgi:hypothetical protein
MLSKNKSRLIYISDFIGLEDRLIVTENGLITKDAREVIYPGASRTAWWDTK